MPGDLVPGEPHAAPGVRLERVGTDRRPAVRLVLTVGAIASFIVVALIKPWGSGAPAGSQRNPAGSTAGGQAVLATPGPRGAVGYADVAFVPGPQPSIAPATVRAALQAHDCWGVRAVVETPGGRAAPATLVERWAAATSPDGWATPAVSDAAVRALGVTVPSGVLVLDVRVFRQMDGGEQWLDVAAVGDGQPGTAPLLWPPRSAAGWTASWPPGSYRFMVLTADGVVNVGAALPGSATDLIGLGSGGWLWGGTTALGDWLAPGTRLAQGLFAGVIPATAATTAPGRPPVLAELGGLPTTAIGVGATWVDALAGQPTATAAHVVSAYLPRTVVIGVTGPANLVIQSAYLLRLVPGPAAGAPDPVALARPIVTTLADRPYQEAVRFEEPFGRPWEPGVYAAFIEGNGASGRDTLAYVLTLLPGSARELAAPLAATRAWARFAGGWGVAAGLAEPIGSPGRLAIRFAPQSPEPATSGGADFGQRCLQVNLVDTSLALVGISHPVDVRPRSVGIQRVYLDGSDDRPQPAVAIAVVPGLTLVAAGEGSGWEPGWYRLLVNVDGQTSSLPVCVGAVNGSTLGVPATAGLRAVGD